MSLIKPVSYSRHKFKRLIKESSAKSMEDIRFHYNRWGNDEYTKNGQQRKMATLEFYVILPEYRVLIEYREHRRSHDILEEELTKKFTYWAKQAIKEKQDVLH